MKRPLSYILLFMFSIVNFSSCQLIMSFMEYEVTFDYQEATQPTSTLPIIVKYGETVTSLPTAPTKTNYIFGGWWTEQNGAGTEFDSDTIVLADITVYAKWTIITYIVTFDSQSATIEANPKTKTVVINQSVVTLPAAPTKTNYIFGGWWTEQNGAGTEFESDTIITADIIVYAKWLGLPRVFRAQKDTDNSWYDVTADCLAVGTNCLVYAENTSSVSSATATAIANEFDTNIYTNIQSNFGVESDVDDNDKIILLFLNIIDGFNGSGGYIAGYFDPTHVFSKSTYTNSNEADMIFLDTYPSSINTPDSFSTIAHEFQHLINFSNTYLVNETEQETWINEGLSSGAEYVYSGTVDQDRLDYYNEDPYDTIIFGNNFFVWSGYWENIDDSRDVLANYSTVYLFFQWLRIHASNGIGIYKEILGSSYRDYRAVTSSASVRISSSFNTWAVLLRTWMESNLLNLSTGYKGYLSKISTTSHCFNSLNNYEWYLSPGEGVASINGTGSFVPTAGSGTNVKYIGLTATGIEDTISPYTGTAVLSFNANTLISGYDETCFLASVETTLDSLDFDRIIKIENTLPALFPIHVTFKVGGGFEDNSHHIIHSSREKNTANRQQQRILRLVSNLDE